MTRCRTKSGELRLRHEGKDYVLDGGGLDLPDALAESIRPHVNVVIEDAPAPAAAPTPRQGRKSRDEESED